MRSFHTHFGATMLALGSAFAQTPTPNDATATRPHPEVALQSLQLLMGEAVYQQDPLGASAGGDAGGTASERMFANIRDARFERDGRLAALIVESPTSATQTAGQRLELPARDVRWDELSHRWITVECNLQIAALKPVATKTALDPQPAAEKPLLASELVQASAGGLASAAVRESIREEATDKHLPKPVIWFVPDEQTIAFATVPHDKLLLPLPWPRVRLSEHDRKLELLIDVTKGGLHNAPQCEDATQPPSAELRLRCYAHYGLEPPKWEPHRQAGEGDAAGKASEHATGREDARR